MADLDAFLAEAPGKSLYALLGVPHTGTIAELKKAYRRLCLWCHPDKNPNPRAADAFLLVCSAFELLSDPSRRKAYDASLRPAIPKPAFPKPQYRPVPRYDAFSPNAGRGQRWTEEAWRDAGNWPYDARTTAPSEPRVRPRSAPAKPRPRSAGVESARRRSRERAAAAREQREAMEREAQLRREEAERRRQAGTDEAQRARATARRRAAATAQKRANEARKKYAEASAKTRVDVRPASARRPAKTKTENEDTWKSIMRDLAAPEHSKRRALAHEKLRRELDRHKREWDKFERDFQKSDATRMPLPSLDREPPVAAAPDVRAPADDDVDVRAVQRGGPFVVRHRTEPKDLYAWVSHDAMRLQWRALDMGAADGAPCGFAALDAVDSVRVRHRKGVPVICVKEPGRKLFLELAPESDLSAATWAFTLTHLVRLARESSAFS
jgi:curved DNA-binding protein CbpA